MWRRGGSLVGSNKVTRSPKQLTNIIGITHVRQKILFKMVLATNRVYRACELMIHWLTIFGVDSSELLVREAGRGAAAMLDIACADLCQPLRINWYRPLNMPLYAKQIILSHIYDPDCDFCFYLLLRKEFEGSWDNINIFCYIAPIITANCNVI